MANWRLIDGRDPTDDPDDFPTVTVVSEGQLRSELGGLIQREPGIVALVSPTGEALQIGIGGPFAGIRWKPDPRSLGMREVLADRPYTDQRLDYASEGDTIAFWPENLMPAEQAADLILTFYRSGQLPAWVGWKEWNDVTKEWVVKRSRGKETSVVSPPTPSREVTDIAVPHE